MDHDSFHSKYTPYKSPTQNNEDLNATAIDCMLVNIRVIFQKIILFRKCLKQTQQQRDTLTEQQVDERTNLIENESKNLNLILPTHIPPDKRMTALFYMRICKEINYYKNILDSLAKILPIMEDTYSIQMKDGQYSITALYLICEKKIVQEAIMLKRKNLNQLQSIKKKINMMKQSTKIVKDQINTFFDHEDLNYNSKKPLNVNLSEIQHLETHLLKSVKKISSPVKTEKKYDESNLPQVMRNNGKNQLFIDFKERIPLIFQQIYACLDLGLPQIIDYYVPTLRPEDNIDIIYRKQNQRNKKSKKQIKQFQAQYTLFMDRRAYIQKKKMMRNRSLVKSRQPAPLPEKKIPERKRQITEIAQNSQPNKKKSYSIDPFSPMRAKPQTQQRKRIKSKFRERIQQSIVNSKQANNFLQKRKSSNQIIKLNSLSMKTGHSESECTSPDKYDKENIQKSIFSDSSKKKMVKFPLRKQQKSKGKIQNFRRKLKL